MIETAPVVAAEPHEQPVPQPAAEPQTTETDAPLVESDLLVEDVSIDGMCGVY